MQKLTVECWPTLSIKMNSCKHKCEGIPGHPEDTMGSQHFQKWSGICMHSVLAFYLSSLHLFLAFSLAFWVFVSSMQMASAVSYSCVTKCKWENSIKCQQENKFQKQVTAQDAFYTHCVNCRCELHLVSAMEILAEVGLCGLLPNVCYL